MWLAGTVSWPCRSVWICMWLARICITQITQFHSEAEWNPLCIPADLIYTRFVFDYRLRYWWKSKKLHGTTPQQKCHVSVRSRRECLIILWIDYFDHFILPLLLLRDKNILQSVVGDFHPKPFIPFGPLGPWLKSDERRSLIPFSRMATPSKDVKKSVSFYEMCSLTVCLPTESINQIVQGSANSSKSRTWDRITPRSFPVVRWNII